MIKYLSIILTFYIALFAPLFLAADRPISTALLTIGIAALLLVWAVTAVFNPENFRTPAAAITWAAVAFATVTAWAMVQTLPFTPTAWHHPAYEIARQESGYQGTGAISPDVGRSLFSLMRLLTYAVVFWLAHQLFRSHVLAMTALKTVALAGGAYALYGLTIYFTGNGWVAFWPKVAYEESLTATFVGRSGAATFFGIVLLCQTACLRQELAPIFAAKLSLPEKIQEAFGKFWSLTGLVYLSWLLTLPALLLTGARAGAICTLIGMGVFFLLPVKQNKSGTKFLIKFVTLSLLMLGAIFFYSLHGTLLQQRLDRMDTSLEDGGRFQTYALVLKAIADAPLTGQGYGSFQYVFPLYKDNTMVGTRFWNMAHNTYLELLFDLGIPAFLLLMLSIGLVLFAMVKVYWSRERKLLPALGLSIAVLVGSYGLLDFSLQIPAIAALVAMLCGAATVPSSRRWAAST